MSGEFPQRFLMDGDSPDVGTWPGGYVCYDVSPPDDLMGDWWFEPDQWVEDDGEIRVYMATSGIGEVVYYGSDESAGDVPGSPRTAAIHFDASAICPELPDVWMPDPDGFPDRAHRICVLHSDAAAEAMFVRVP